jgi:hypothetical protein
MHIDQYRMDILAAQVHQAITLGEANQAVLDLKDPNNRKFF